MKPITPDYIYLNVLLCASMMQAGFDALQGTPYYKQRLKASAKTFAAELDKVIRQDIQLVWGVDDKTMYQQMDYKEQLLKEVMTMKPEVSGIMLEMLHAYKEHPAQTLKRLGIRLLSEVEQEDKKQLAA